MDMWLQSELLTWARVLFLLKNANNWVESALIEGCIPSKTLIHAVELLDNAEHAPDLGITFSKPEIDLDKLREWTTSVVSNLTKGVDTLLTKRGC